MHLPLYSLPAEFPGPAEQFDGFWIQNRTPCYGVHPPLLFNLAQKGTQVGEY